MRLRELTEAKFRKSVTMFHGTSSVFLPTILSNGLMPNPKKKKWDVDPNISLRTQSRVSLPGSYWTSNLLTATGSAQNTKNKFGGEIIVVIAQIQTRSAMADEDNITDSLQSEYNSAFGGIYSDNPDLVASVYYDLRDYYEQTKQKYIKLTHRKLSGDDEKKPIPEKLLGQTFDALTLRIIAHGIKDAGNRSYDNPMNRVTNKPDNTPTVPETEQNLLNIKDKLTRYYRESTEDASAFRHTLRITDPVTYRGANRITHIVEIPDGYVKDGKYTQPPLISHYGGLELPTKFMDDYTSRVGKFPGIEKEKKESYNENKKTNLKKKYNFKRLNENNIPDDWENILDDPSSTSEIKKILKNAKKIHKNFYLINDTVIEWNGIDLYPSMENKHDWIENIDIEIFYPNWLEEFNKNFWNFPEILYHQTQKKYINFIMKNGLIVQSKTRGVTNKNTGNAIFTTMEFDDTYTSSYGDVIIEIDTPEMKKNNFTPFVTLELPIQEARAREQIAKLINIQDYFYIDSSDGLRETTVVIYDNIPSKYLTIIE